MNNRTGNAILLVGIAVFAAIPWAVSSASEDASPESRNVLTNAIEASVFIRAERVFKLEHFPSYGSGFFVHEDGFILTNWHVVADQFKAHIWGEEREVSAKVLSLKAVVRSGTPRERELPARIIARDRTRDLALLKVEWKPETVIDVKRLGNPGIGDSIWAAGFPFGEMLSEEGSGDPSERRNPSVSISSGIVTSLKRDREGVVSRIQTDAALNPGNSGGPMINQRGELVGVAVSGVFGGDGIGFGVSPERIREFITAKSVIVSVVPRNILSPPVPLRVTLRPTLVDIDDDGGSVTLEGGDIHPVSVSLTRMASGWTAEVPIPESIPDVERPEKYLMTLSYAATGTSEPVFRRYSINVVPESYEKLTSQRDPAKMMSDRKWLNQEMDLSTFTDSEDVASDSVDRGSMADAAKGFNLKRSESGSVVIDNSAVRDVSNPSSDYRRYERLRGDPDALRLAREYDRLNEAINRAYNPPPEDTKSRKRRTPVPSRFEATALTNQRISIADHLRSKGWVLCIVPRSFFVQREQVTGDDTLCERWLELH